MSFLQKAAIEVLSRHVKDDASAEAVFNEYLGVFFNDRSPILSVEVGSVHAIPSLRFIAESLSASVSKTERGPFRRLGDRRPYRTAFLPCAESLFLRVDEPRAPAERSSEFILRHFTEVPQLSDLLSLDPGFRHASYEESVAFHERRSLVSRYFRIVVLGSTWRHPDHSNVSVHVEWYRDKPVLTSDTALTEDCLLLLAKI